MPARPNGIFCKCPACISESADGKWIPKSLLNAHLARSKAQAIDQERTARDDAAHAQAELDSASARLLALTLTDNGPDVVNQPSRLWSSRAAFQESMRSNVQLPDSEDFPVGDVVDAVKRLALTHNDVSQNATSPTSKGAHRRISKQERNRHTTRALEVLDAIDRHILESRHALLDIPSNDVLRNEEVKVGRLRTGIEAVRRRTPEVDKRKDEISEDLNKLEARIVVLRTLVPGLTNDPIRYNCGEKHFLCVSLCV